MLSSSSLRVISFGVKFTTTRRSLSRQRASSSSPLVASLVLYRNSLINNRGGRSNNNNIIVKEEMGSMTGNEEQQFKSEQRKPRFLCLHGFRTSGDIMKKQIHKWPQSVLDKMDLIFLDAPFPAEGKSAVEGLFDPPYYEWFQTDKEFMEYRNFDECLAFIEECMIKHGPIDGFMGFSQGAILSAALPGLQEKGLALKKVPKIKFLIIIGGAKLKSPSMAEKAYSSTIDCPSLHFLGETDFLKPHGIPLLDSFVNPIVIHHPKGHTVPRLDEKSLELMMGFLESIQHLSVDEPTSKLGEEN